MPAVVADHLRAFVGDVLGGDGQEVRGREDLGVVVDFGVEPGTVDDGVAGDSIVIFSTEKGFLRM